MEHENSVLSQLPLTCVPKQLPHMHHCQKQHKAGKRRGRDGTSLVDDDDVWVAGVGGVGGEGEGVALPLSMTMTSGLQGWVGRGRGRGMGSTGGIWVVEVMVPRVWGGGTLDRSVVR